MREVVWQYDPEASSEPTEPDSFEHGLDLLAAGNEEFVATFGDDGSGTRRVVTVSPADLGLPDSTEAPAQRPFASVLACSDARAPVELVLGQRVNSTFVVRAAGNVVGPLSLASLDYGVQALASVKVQLVLGHTYCGAVTAAVNSYLDGETYVSTSHGMTLQWLTERILGPARIADQALIAEFDQDVTQRPGYRRALVATAVVANAASTAHALEHRYLDRSTGVAMAVYDLGSRRVGLPGEDGSWRSQVIPAPGTPAETLSLVAEFAANPYVATLLDADE
jgi:carbonic anhydrase